MQRSRLWLEAYYGATPLFAALDWTLGANVRAVALAGHPGWRLAYYAACLACAVLVWRRPAWSELVGLAESSANLLLLALAVWLPYLALAEQLADGAPASHSFTPGFLANLALSGAVCILSAWTSVSRTSRSR